jgi:23S rRNA pseudouridine1911/1915/1917 synthase
MVQVLWEDFHFIAVYKPAMLPTQAPAAFDSAEAQVKAYIKEKYQKPAGVYLGIPHRLDKPVSGVVIFARNSKAAARLAHQFETKTVAKSYQALIAGQLPETQGTWHNHLRKIEGVAKGEICEVGAPGAKEAITHYRVLSTTLNTSLVELQPQTGRMHQLRLQASSRGVPILGDSLYGSTLPFLEGQPQRIALHAHSLKFLHPFRKVEVALIAELDADWQSVLQAAVK